MSRILLIIIAAYCLILGFVMWFAPQYWYDATPGVAMMGPFNSHFIRDAGLAFLTSGGALFYGVLKPNRPLAIFGAMWPCLHAAFHIWIWLARGIPFDQVALVNLVGIQLPAWLALMAAIRLQGDPQ